MEIKFTTRMEAIDWIAEHAESEAHFEVLREQLNYNYIYYGTYFLSTDEPIGEVVFLK